MKKSITILIVILFALPTFCQEFVTIPDTNFLAALIEEGVDTDEDGKISYEEAEAIDSDLDLRGSEATHGNIADLTGIQNFINLKRLYCGFNVLTDLDVSDNPALEIVQCNDNHLSEIDVTSNPNLLSLVCSNNQISSIDVSNNLRLVDLQCGGNKLTRLDLSNNDSLFSLLHAGYCFVFGNLDLSDMQELHEVCISESFALPDSVDTVCGTWPGSWLLDTTGSPNICMETDCDGECSNTGMKNRCSELFEIYPNPTHTTFILSFESPIRGNIEIHTLNGQLIQNRSITSTSDQIDMSSYAEGIYFVTVRSDAWVRTEKVVRY